MAKQAQQIIEGEIVEVFDLEKSLAEVEQELMANETFQRFLELQQKVPAQIAATWKKVEQQMIEHDIKSIKGEWGSITIAERLNWKTTEDLPAKFYKKVVDTTRLSNTFKLEGKPIKGAEPYYTKYLTKRIKPQGGQQ